MRHFQPTVRQLQPLGRRFMTSAPIVRERVATHARETVTDSPDATTSSAPSSPAGGAGSPLPRARRPEVPAALR